MAISCISAPHLSDQRDGLTGSILASIDGDTGLVGNCGIELAQSRYIPTEFSPNNRVQLTTICISLFARVILRFHKTPDSACRIYSSDYKSSEFFKST